MARRLPTSVDSADLRGICRHQQGDVVLRHIAQSLDGNSREVGYPARYGGEELAVIHPHTGLVATCAIASESAWRSPPCGYRVSTAAERFRSPPAWGGRAANDGDSAALVAEADAGLDQAKRRGKKSGGSFHRGSCERF